MMTGESSPIRAYLGVFAVLLVLTGVTMRVAYMDLGPLNDFVALAIAFTKALAVALYFMHLRHEERLTKIFVALTFLFLAILLVFTLSDFLTKTWQYNPQSWLTAKPR